MRLPRLLLELVALPACLLLAAILPGGAYGQTTTEQASEPSSSETEESGEANETDPAEADSSEAKPAPEADSAKPPASEEDAKPAEEQPAKPGLLDEMPPGNAENPGQAALDEALELKLAAENLKDLNEVIDLLDQAISEGLDAANNDFAENLLVAALEQRASSLSGVILNEPVSDPRRDPRWLQIRQFALTDLQRIVSPDPTKIDAWLRIGRLQSLPLGSSSEARRAMTRVIQLAKERADDPQQDALDQETLAQAYALRGATQKAPADQMDDFNKAIELAPEKAEYLLLRAQANRVASNAEATLADIDKAIELSPDNPKVHELKALALLMQDKQEEAMKSFDKASELAPTLLSPYQYRGELFSQLGQTDEAIEQLDEALELSPNNLASLLIRAQLLLANEEFERALADIDAILKQQPGLVRAHLMKAQTLDKLGRTDDAVAWLTRLIDDNPERPELLIQLAVFYVDKQMATEAIEVLTTVLEMDDTNELARRLRGDMYLFAGDHEAAIADFQTALEANPMETGVLNNYAWTLATSPFDDIRDGKKAIELATKAAEITEYNAPHILSTLAAAYAEAGDFEEAVRRSEQTVAKAKELGMEEQYDGQLEAELNSYRDKQPWRELQQMEIAGPADETAEQLKGLKKSGEQTEAEESEKPQVPLDETPARSIDF